MELITMLLWFTVVAANGERSNSAISTGRAGTTSPCILIPTTRVRRQAVEPNTCGFIDGSKDSPIVCPTGQCDFSTRQDDPATLAAGCRSQNQGPYPIGCVDYAATTPLPSTDTLFCPSNSPYCQTFTWPEVPAVFYDCGQTSTTEWVYISHTSSSSTSTSVGPSPTSGKPPGTDLGRNSFTLAQKVGTAVGSICGGCIFAGGLFFCCRRQRRERAQLESRMASKKQLTSETNAQPQLTSTKRLS